MHLDKKGVIGALTVACVFRPTSASALTGGRDMVSQLPSSEFFLLVHSFPPTSSLWSVDLVKIVGFPFAKLKQLKL
jgi:hypothetical protein